MNFFPVIASLFFLASCKKENSAYNLQAAYFPMNEGKFVIYSVQEVVINNDLEQNDTTRYFLKTRIGEVETDNEGRPARRYERYIRYDASAPWILKDIWTTILDGRRVELVEENQRVIKMVLAPDKIKEWDMNAYNMLGEANCYYDNIHEPGGINGYNFDSTVKVVQEDGTPNAIEFKHKYELYAKHVGMYYKHYKDYRINFYDTTNITKGNEVIMRLISHGQE